VIVIHLDLLPVPLDDVRMAMTLVQAGAGQDFPALTTTAEDPEAIEGIAYQR